MAYYTKRKLKIVLSVIVIFVLAFSLYPEYVKYCIDNGDYKYWYEQKGSNIYLYFFDSNGYCTEFKKSLFSSLKLCISDDIRDNKWVLQNSSKLRFDGSNSDIKFVAPGLMVLTNNSAVKVLRSVPPDAIPQRFRRKGPFQFEVSKKRNFWVKPGTQPYYWDD